MTTIEKLFVQIFEMKKRIIEQVKYRTDSFDNHLACLCIIEGIAPPSWLLSPSFPSVSSNLNDLKKEELIPGLLLPRSQSANPYFSSHYSSYEEPIVTARNKGLQNASFTEVYASNDGTNAGDRLSVLPPLPTDDRKCTFNDIPELDPGVMSPPDCADARILDNCDDHSRSLVKIQRSKSRQRALELRNGTTATKLRSCEENNAGLHTSQAIGSGINFLQYDHFHELGLVKQVDANIEICGEEDAKIGECEGTERNFHINNARIIRSGSSRQQISFANEPGNDGHISHIAKEDGLEMSSNGFIPPTDNVIKLSEPFEPPILAKTSCVVEENFVDCRGKKKNSIVSSDRLRRFRSSVSEASISKEPLVGGESSFIAEVDDGHREALEKPVKHTNSFTELPELVKPSLLISNESYGSRKGKTRDKWIKEKDNNIYVGRITRSRSSIWKVNCTNECLKLDNSYSNGKENGKREPKQLSDHAHELKELVKHLDSANESCWMKAKMSDCQKVDTGSDAHCCRKTFSSSTGKLNGFNEFSKVDISSGIVKETEGTLLNSFSKFSESPDRSSLVEEGANLQVLLGTQPNVLPCAESIMAETDLNCNGLAETCSINLKSSLDAAGYGVGVLGSRPPSECAALVRPKQLDFDDAEESNLPETFDLALENKQEGKSEKQLSSLQQSMDLLDKVTSTDYQEKLILSTEMPLLEEHGLPSKQERSGKDSSEAYIKDNAGLLKERSFNSVQQQTDSLMSKSQNTDPYLIGSWPQHKRIKIGSQLMNALSASPNLKTKPFQSIHKHQMGDAAQSDVFTSPAEDMIKNAEHQKIEEPEFSLSKLQDDEIAINLEGKSAAHALTPMLDQEAPLLSSSKKGAAGVSQGCLLDKPVVADPNRTVFDVTSQYSSAESKLLLRVEDKLEHGTVEILSYAEDTTIQERRYPFGGKDNLSHLSSGSPLNLSMIGADQNMPEFEGFVVETDTEQPCTANEGINFDKLDLPPTALVLEQLCKSTSLNTPLSHFSGTYKLQEPLNVYHSIPNGLLEGIELRSTLNMNGDDSKLLDSSYSCLSKGVNHGLQGKSHSVSLPLLNAQSGWDITKPCMSPVGKFWDGIPQKSGSSGKRVCSIPELPCISEENENMDGVADTLEEGICPEVEMGLVRRKPFIDITKHSNPLMSVCEAEIHGDRSSLASTNTEFGFSGTCDRGKRKLRRDSKRRFTSKDKENQNLSLGGDGVKRCNGSLHSRFSKPKLSEKIGLRKEGLSLSDKEPKRNNIVSNVTSFIPLVQQKQAAAVITGKRDIKVKALEAAEAAKHLAEKKENERKMRKEALRIERAKMEEKNLRQLEAEKKKKEEEKKKKEADKAVKKRQREEEEKKEKERKRMRVEEAKRVHLEHEKKLQIKKEEREVKSQAPDERACDNKESKKRFEKPENIEKAKGENVHRTLPGTETTTINIPTIDTITPEDHEVFSDCGDNLKVMNLFGKASESHSLVSNVTQEQSYEISPYKGSDDEDEEEDDDMRNSKFIPSWARKSQLAQAVSSQQRIDPESIFLRESFCSISEVLLPRRLQQK